MIAAVLLAGLGLLAFIWRQSQRVERPICRFDGCDDDATVANARGPLCALHANSLEELCIGSAGAWNGVERRVIRAGDHARIRRFTDVYEDQSW